MRAAGATPAHILVVDDEPSITELLATALRYMGYQVTVADSGFAALDAAATSAPDLVVLDVMLPDLDGFEVCRRLRAARDFVPVIFLSARDSEGDRVTGFVRGGDDYVTKPFSLEELTLRISALLRRVGKGADGDVNPRLRYRDLEMDEDRHQVWRAGLRSCSPPPSSACSATSCSTRSASCPSSRSWTTSGSTTSTARTTSSRPTSRTSAASSTIRSRACSGPSAASATCCAPTRRGHPRRTPAPDEPPDAARRHARGHARARARPGRRPHPRAHPGQPRAAHRPRAADDRWGRDQSRASRRSSPTPTPMPAGAWPSCGWTGGATSSARFPRGSRAIPIPSRPCPPTPEASPTRRSGSSRSGRPSMAACSTGCSWSGGHETSRSLPSPPRRHRSMRPSARWCA